MRAQWKTQHVGKILLQSHNDRSGHDCVTFDLAKLHIVAEILPGAKR